MSFDEQYYDPKDHALHDAVEEIKTLQSKLRESEAGAADKDKRIAELKREVDKLSSVICCKCGPVFRQGNVNERARHF